MRSRSCRPSTSPGLHRNRIVPLTIPIRVEAIAATPAVENILAHGADLPLIVAIAPEDGAIALGADQLRIAARPAVNDVRYSMRKYFGCSEKPASSRVLR